jgi:hypothetical protein
LRIDEIFQPINTLIRVTRQPNRKDIHMKLIFSLLVLAVGSARCDLIPTLQSISTLNDGFAWEYQVNLASGSRLEAGSYLTLYDFSGLIGAVAPTGWAYSIQPLGVTPSKTLPTDSSVDNVTFFWTGTPVAGPVSLGPFIVKSTLSGPVVTATTFTSSTVKDGGGVLNGTLLMNIGSAEGPLAPTETPEPAAMGTTAVALIAMVYRFAACRITLDPKQAGKLIRRRASCVTDRQEVRWNR